MLVIADGHVRGKACTKPQIKRAHAQRRRDGDFPLDFFLLIFHQSVAPLGFLALEVEHDQQVASGGVVVQAHVRLVHARRRRPVDVAHGIA